MNRYFYYDFLTPFARNLIKLIRFDHKPDCHIHHHDYTHGQTTILLPKQLLFIGGFRK